MLSHVEENIPLGRGLRAKQSSVRLKDYVTHTVIRQNPISPSPTPSASAGTPF
ncbi:unnamed protein product, partial [Cuscuta europaea]